MEKILVIQTAFPGDAILTLPMIQKLKELYPKSLIDVVAIPSTREIFHESPPVSNVISYDKKGAHKSLFSLISLGLKIRATKYTRLFSPHRSLRTSLLVLMSGVEYTAGFDRASLNIVYKKLVKYNPGIHEVERNLSLIGIPKGSDWRIKPEINDTDISGILPPDFHKNKTIALAPGSVWQTKKYPVEHFKKIVSHLVSNSYKIILLGGEEDRGLCEMLNIENGTSTLNLAGMVSIVQSVTLLKCCSLLISNDSAPTHMAMAAGIPAVTIYCSTVPEFGFYPYRGNSLSISYNNLECKPCGIHGHNQCPVKTFDCAHLLKPEEILGKIHQLFNP